MYSLVLMAAMTGGPDVPEFGGGGVGWDTSLCILRTCKMPYHSPVNCCFYETCLPTRYGWASPAGCCGEYRYGGCYGSCYGGCGGCSSWGASCCGIAHSYATSCTGCGGGIYSLPTGCHGSACYGSACHGSACHGSVGYGCMNYDPYYHGVGYAGFSGYGNFGAYGSAPVLNPADSIVIPTPSPKPAMTPLLRNDDLSIPKPNATVKASIILTVPENATVFVDDIRMSSKGSLRVFTTPELEVGQDYYYTVRIALEKDGKSYEESKRVIVRPGDSSQLAFSEPKGNRDTLTSGLGR